MTISVVIPSAYADKQRDDNLKQLIAEIWQQSLPPQEIVVVRGARPRTKAHNRGANAASGDLLIFFDDDVRLGHARVIKELAEVFARDKQVGVAGLSIVAPKESTPFQRRAAAQLLKARNMIAHAALAIPRALYQEVGGEDERLRLNDDAQLNYKVKAKNYRTLLLAPEYFVYHPELNGFSALLKKYFSQGFDQAQDYKTDASLIFSAPLSEQAEIKKSSLGRQVLRNLKILGEALVKGKLLLLASRLATGIGFGFGYLAKTSLVSSQGKIEIISAPGQNPTPGCRYR